MQELGISRDNAYQRRSRGFKDLAKLKEQCDAMSTPDQVLSDFIDAWNAGRRPRVREYLARLPDGAERDELAEQITTWLELAPTPAYDDAARAAIRGEPAVAPLLAVGDDAGLWPDCCPACAPAPACHRAELAAACSSALGSRADDAERTGAYLERLERGDARARARLAPAARRARRRCSARRARARATPAPSAAACARPRPAARSSAPSAGRRVAAPRTSRCSAAPRWAPRRRRWTSSTASSPAAPTPDQSSRSIARPRSRSTAALAVQRRASSVPASEGDR